MKTRHDETIRREFSKQASYFGEKGHTLSSQEYLEWMVGILPLHRGFRVLDVATGTAHLARAVAPHVEEVVAIDMTPAMLEEARKEIVRQGIKNIQLEQGDAQCLPYANDAFDMVVSRLALHHFETPGVQLGEMVRVCKPGHVIGIMDLLSPEDEALAERYNYLERLRDPSHACALTRTQLISAMEVAGLSVTHIDMTDVEVGYERWVAMTGANQSAKAAIRKALEREIEGGEKTGMRPYLEHDRLKFLQVWSVIAGTKNSTPITS